MQRNRSRLDQRVNDVRRSNERIDRQRQADISIKIRDYLVSGEVLNYAGENGFPPHRRGHVGYWLLEFRI